MICGDNVYLRAPEPDDVDAIFRWENDRDIWSSAGVRAPMSRHLIWKYVNDYTADLYADTQSRFIICRIADNMPVGAVDLYDADMINRRCGVGIVVDKAHRGFGYAAEALRLLGDYAWKDLGLHQLWAIVDAANMSSRSLFSDGGYSVGGRLRSWIRVGESYSDAYIYQRLLCNGQID